VKKGKQHKTIKKKPKPVQVLWNSVGGWEKKKSLKKRVGVGKSLKGPERSGQKKKNGPTGVKKKTQAGRR